MVRQMGAAPFVGGNELGDILMLPTGEAPPRRISRLLQWLTDRPDSWLFSQEALRGLASRQWLFSG